MQPKDTASPLLQHLSECPSCRTVPPFIHQLAPNRAIIYVRYDHFSTQADFGPAIKANVSCWLKGFRDIHSVWVTQTPVATHRCFRRCR